MARIADSVTPQTRTIEVWAELANPDGRFRPEMFGEVRHIESYHKVATVPATAVREQLRIVVIVFADETLSLIDIKQRQRNLTSRGVEMGPISWSSIAQGFGAAAFMADGQESLGGAIDRALGCAGPALIEVKIDPGNYSSLLRTIRG